MTTERGMSGLRTHARCATARRSNDLAARNAAADVAGRGWPLFLADEECLLIGGVVGKVVDAAGAAVGHRTARQRVEVRSARLAESGQTWDRDRGLPRAVHLADHERILVPE